MPYESLEWQRQPVKARDNKSAAGFVRPEKKSPNSPISADLAVRHARIWNSAKRRLSTFQKKPLARLSRRK